MHDKTQKTNTRLTLLWVGIFYLLSVSSALAASPKRSIKEGNRLYQQGEYEASKEKYQEALTKAPESDIINFNLGTALYKEKEYESAVEHFRKAFLSDDAELKEKAHYNLGNTLYRLGLTQEHAAIEQAVSSIEQSLKQYERALEIDREDKDTLHNHAFVEKELKRLKMQLQKRQQQQRSDQQQEPGDSQDQKQQQGGEQQPQQGEEQKRQPEQHQRPQADQRQGTQQQQNDRPQGQEDQPQEAEQRPAQQSSRSGKKGEDQQQNTSVPIQGTEALTKEEAQMRLESYQQTEEPQGLLNFQKRIQDSRPVSKDW
jgi:tetratricopeptide (TPR) repeat protein